MNSIAGESIGVKECNAADREAKTVNGGEASEGLAMDEFDPALHEITDGKASLESDQVVAEIERVGEMRRRMDGKAGNKLDLPCSG